MDEPTEWWRILTRLSPFLIAIASAVVALFIRDLLEPRQWQRYVRKSVASAFAGIMVFATISAVYILLLERPASEDNPLALFASWVVGLGIIPATILVAVLVFQGIEPDLDSYMNSRFVYSFQNGSWPALSMQVCSDCLPEDANSIGGRITAVRDSTGEYHIRVDIGTENDVITVLNRTTRYPQRGWMQVMQAVLRAQLGDFRENLNWQDRIRFYSRLRERLGGWTSTPTPPAAAQYRWQNLAYVQIHRLAIGMDAGGGTPLIRRAISVFDSEDPFTGRVAPRSAGALSSPTYRS